MQGGKGKDKGVRGDSKGAIFPLWVTPFFYFNEPLPQARAGAAIDREGAFMGIANEEVDETRLDSVFFLVVIWNKIKIKGEVSDFIIAINVRKSWNTCHCGLPAFTVEIFSANRPN
ncbi:hypothetical protein ACFOU2_16215 [Bacillus songklensis]|uniref:Uncharacterized protein n=1 Tax=Bacillus songklensis TaxID=1069116 RepID=A0ABV8B3W7_9BACI